MHKCNSNTNPKPVLFKRIGGDIMGWLIGKIGNFTYHHCSKCGFSPDTATIGKKLPEKCPLCGTVMFKTYKTRKAEKDGKKKKGTS